MRRWRSIGLYITYFLILAVAVIVSRSGVIFDLRSRAVGTPAKISVNPSVTYGDLPTDFYHAFAQGGEETGDMLYPVSSYVSALRPKLIRLDHIFDNYHLVHVTDGRLSFDFRELDAAVKTIRGTGATPFFALSYMPPGIAENGDITGPPRNWADWSRVVQVLIEHYSGRQAQNIPDVWYEVWNEPDLFGNWTIGGTRDYVSLYKYAAIGADQTRDTNRFLFGGPATTLLLPQWISALAESGARLDFLSFHSYDQDPQVMAESVSRIKQMIKSFPALQHTPVVISEFGFTGAKDARYSTMYAAAYTAAAFRSLLDSGVSYLFTFQLKDGPGQGNAGWGLLTYEAKEVRPKPRYDVFSFVDAVAGTRIRVQGEGTWIRAFATRRTDGLRLLLVNYDPAGTHTETFPVTFTSLSPGTYTLTTTFLRGASSSRRYVVSGNSLTTDIYMPAASVARLELTGRTTFGTFLN